MSKPIPFLSLERLFTPPPVMWARPLMLKSCFKSSTIALTYNWVGFNISSPIVVSPLGILSLTSKPPSSKIALLAKLKPLLWIPLLLRPIKISPSWISAPVMILSLSTKPIPVPAKSKSLTIPGSEAVSPPMIAIWDSFAPWTRPSAISSATFGSGSSTAK